jgi:hypothetical protein
LVLQLENVLKHSTPIQLQDHAQTAQTGKLLAATKMNKASSLNVLPLLPEVTIPMLMTKVTSLP